MINYSKRFRMNCMYLLRIIEQEELEISASLPGDELYLKDIVAYLIEYGLLEINVNQHFQITEKGKYHLKLFSNRYDEYVLTFEVFSDVDILNKEFIYTEFIKSGMSFQDLLDSEYYNSKVWYDIRLLVGEYKKYDIDEIYLFQMIMNNYITYSSYSYAYNLGTGNIWANISAQDKISFYKNNIFSLSNQQIHIRELIDASAEIIHIMNEFDKENGVEFTSEQDKIIQNYCKNPYYKSDNWLNINSPYIWKEI